MSKFKVGDKVKRKDDKVFSNGKPIATVGEWIFNFEPDGKVALMETDKYIYENRIELATNSPVRETTVVKKEIIPGTYGDVKIWPAGTICIHGMSGTDKKRLAEAIKTLQLIHDALE